MNSDFEKQLKQQPMRKVPRAWKAEILQAASASSRSQPSTLNSQPSWFHQLFWPCPQAWAGVAAVWVVIFVLNFSSSEHAPKMASVTAVGPEIKIALKQQRLFEAELIGLAEPGEEPKHYLLKPRSERTLTTVAV